MTVKPLGSGQEVAIMQANDPGCPEPVAEVPEGGLSITSHSFSLRTKLFTLDYTWRNVQLSSSSQEVPSSCASPGVSSSSSGQLSFADQMRRRMDLASLLDPVTPCNPGPSSQCQTLGPLGASPRRACSAYQRVQGDGPLGGEGSF